MASSELGSSGAELGLIELAGTGSASTIFNVSVTNTLTVGQTNVTQKIATLSVTSTADIGQAIEFTESFIVSVSNSADVGQTISVIRELHVSIINTSTVNQDIFVNSPRVVSVSSQAFVTQRVVGVNATFFVTVSQGVSVGQIILGRQGLYRVSVVSSANISSRFVPRDLVLNVSVANTLTVKQKINSEYRLTIVSTANIAQTLGSLRITTQHFQHINTLTDTFTPTRESLHLLTQLLTLSESYVHSGTYERDFSHIQTLTDTFRQAIVVSDSGYVYDPYPVGPGQPPRVIPPHPVATGTPLISAKETVISSPGGTVILPAVEFGETFGAKVQNTVKKTMTGKIYTYVRTNLSDRFTLSWVLGLQKALELASVIKNNNDNFLGPNNFYIITLFNGQIWKAKVVSTDIPLIHEARWQNSDNNASEIEKMTISIQFEGTQLL